MIEDERPQFSEEIPDEDAAPARIEDADFEAPYAGEDLSNDNGS